jgi:hypothetical protein
MWHAWERTKNVNTVLVRKPEGKRTFGKLRRRRKDGIGMDVTEIGWGGGVERIHQVQDRNCTDVLVSVKKLVGVCNKYWPCHVRLLLLHLDCCCT